MNTTPVRIAVGLAALLVGGLAADAPPAVSAADPPGIQRPAQCPVVDVDPVLVLKFVPCGTYGTPVNRR